MAWPKWLVDGGEEEKAPQEPPKLAKPLPGTPPVQNPPPHWQQQAAPVPVMVGLDQQAHEKWGNFFNELLTSKGDPQYRQFMAMIDNMGAIPDNVKFPSIYQGLKVMGCTKAGLLDAANKTADMLSKDAETFKGQMDQRHKKEVEDPQALIEQKQQQILKLNQEISELQQGATTAEQKIQTSMLGYSTYFRQAQTKVSNDIASITNFIPD